MNGAITRLGRGLLAFLLLALFIAVVPRAFAGDDIDLGKAVKIGSGKVMVIEFTDPDCPFCRRAEAYFQGKPQVTRYIFFKPLSMHPGAKAKVQYILSARDKVRAYLEAVTGKFDRGALPGPVTPAGMRLQQEHQKIARENNIVSTPTFMIYGRIITGFDMNKLEPLLR